MFWIMQKQEALGVDPVKLVKAPVIYYCQFQSGTSCVVPKRLKFYVVLCFCLEKRMATCLGESCSLNHILNVVYVSGRGLSNVFVTCVQSIYVLM